MKLKITGIVVVTLSRRNLLALLTKLDNPSSLRTIYKGFDDGSTCIVKAEEDEYHYAGVTPGEMSAETERDIAAANDHRT